MIRRWLNEIAPSEWALAKRVFVGFCTALLDVITVACVWLAVTVLTFTGTWQDPLILLTFATVAQVTAYFLRAD